MIYKEKEYRKIILIGPSGSGKSWTTEKLSAITNYKTIYLDKEYWLPGWNYPPIEQWLDKNLEFVSGNEWIIDGNHLETLDIRFKAADLVLFLNINRITCIISIIKRHGHNRIDKPDYLEEKIDKNFFTLLKWIFISQNKRRNAILELHQKYPQREFVVFRTRKQVKIFVNEINK